MSDPTAEPAASSKDRDHLVLREKRGAVMVITLNDPDSRNALSEAMMSGIRRALQVTKAHLDILAVVIAANGPVFSSGHDLKEMAHHGNDPDGGKGAYTRLMSTCTQLMTAIMKYPRPVIAAVEGVATAAGCQLVASCDLAVAGEAARFCTPGVDIGLFCTTPAVALSRKVPRKRAMEMLLLGEMQSAAQAREAGLVNRVVPAGQALAEALAMGEKIAAKSPLTVAIGKEAFYTQLELTQKDAYAYASEVMVHNLMTYDAHEGIMAFLEKRKPKWRGE